MLFDHLAVKVLRHASISFFPLIGWACTVTFLMNENCPFFSDSPTLAVRLWGFPEWWYVTFMDWVTQINEKSCDVAALID